MTFNPKLLTQRSASHFSFNRVNTKKITTHKLPMLLYNLYGKHIVVVNQISVILCKREKKHLKCRRKTSFV